MTILGTRPEIIKLSAIIKLLDTSFNHILVHTGQNWDYTLNEIFFNDLGLRAPDYYLNSVGTHLGHTIGNIIHASYNLFVSESPDALLILGDTNSALATISAKRLKIPIFHMEAGNRCFDQNVPEEINRKIIDHISDVNLAYTEHARRNLLAEGINPAYTFVTGSPMPEVLQAHRPAINQSQILSKLGLTAQNYMLVSSHREENIDNEEHFLSLMTALNTTAGTYKMPIIFSTHPRTQNIIKKRAFKFHPLIQNIQPFGFIDYNHLQQNAFCVLSDSGTLAEESALLGFCGVLLRTSTERPEVMDKGSIVIGGIEASSLLQSIDLAVSLKGAPNILPPDYSDPNGAVKIAKLIQSYTPIINEMIWRKTSPHIPAQDLKPI